MVRAVRPVVSALRYGTAYAVAVLAAGLARVLGFYHIATCLAYTPLRWGECLRYHFYRLTLEGVGPGCTFVFGTVCTYRKVRLGKNVYLGYQNILGEITIGSNVLTGPRVVFLSGRHQHGFDDPAKPICEQSGHSKRLIIGDDVWVGAGATVMANVGSRCVIGAGAVVTHEVESHTIVAGNPARLIKRLP